MTTIQEINARLFGNTTPPGVRWKFQEKFVSGENTSWNFPAKFMARRNALIDQAVRNVTGSHAYRILMAHCTIRPNDGRCEACENLAARIRAEYARLAKTD